MFPLRLSKGSVTKSQDPAPELVDILLNPVQILY